MRTDICYRPAVQEQAAFRRLMDGYLGDGEDEGTPQDVIDAFVGSLYDKCVAGEITGFVAYLGGEPFGFALLMIDSAEKDFSVMPGYGVILDIGVENAFRAKGLGGSLARHAEALLTAQGVAGLYVTAYGPAEAFWRHMGYRKNGDIAYNGLPVLVKARDGD